MLSLSEVNSLLEKHKNSGRIVYLVDDYVATWHYTSPDTVFTDEDSLCFYWTGYGGVKNLLCSISDVLTVTSLDQQIDVNCTHGSDPEFFITKDSEVVPSRALLAGQRMDWVVEDGYQVELNPPSNTCRQSAGTYIGMAITRLYHLAQEKGYNLSFQLAHVIGDKVWKETPNDIKKFGCNPTSTSYRGKSVRSTGLRERFRAGGGHLHIGSPLAKTKRESLVKLLDIVVGNTLVLIDRDPANAVRRKNYGRAGEFRPKTYGLEYRVPSNFWLRGYLLWSLVSGLVRNTLTLRKNNLEEKLLKQFRSVDIRRA